MAQIRNYNDLRELPPQERLQKFKQLIEKNPKDRLAHYLYAAYLIEDTIKLEKQYNFWMKQYPSIAEIPYALGNLFLEENNLKAFKYLDIAVHINPQMVDAWLALSLFFNQKNDLKERDDYLFKGVKANPDNAEINYKYAYSFLNKDQQKFKALLLKTTQKFPNSEYAAKAFYALALNERDKEGKVKYYEKLKSIYFLKKYRITADAMNSYYVFLLEYDINKTIPLLKDLIRPKFRSDDWGLLLFVSSRILMAKDLIKAKKGAEALTILNHVKFPYFVNEPKNLIPILKAQAIATAYTDALAYDSLMVYFLKKPSLGIYRNIINYGLMQQKDSIQIEKDILKILRQNAVKATTFKLINYQSNDSLTLDSLKGNVILLTYWYPQCAPCRAEFSHFENVLKKINNERVKYVAINIVEKQHMQVLPLIKNYNYSFIPLAEKKYRNKGNIDNLGAAPENFLIDQNGILIFKDFRIDEDNEEDLELMINLLIKNH